jgi:hypothetical protein
MLESTTSALLGLLGLNLAVARRRMGVERGQQPMRGCADLDNRTVECFDICL